MASGHSSSTPVRWSPNRLHQGSHSPQSEFRWCGAGDIDEPNGPMRAARPKWCLGLLNPAILPVVTFIVMKQPAVAGVVGIARRRWFSSCAIWTSDADQQTRHHKLLRALTVLVRTRYVPLDAEIW